MNKKIIIPIIAVVLIGVSFYGGMLYGKSQQPVGGSFANMTPEQRQARLAQGGFAGGVGVRGNRDGGFTAGEILSKDDKSITVKLTDGGSKIVFLSPTTQVLKSTTGILNDLAVGTQVVASGNAGSDGSITATSIQIRPAMMATPTPTPPPSNALTMAVVAQHNSAQSCHSAINGSVYDLTSWINQHPGGSERILSICGKDGSSAFSNKHEGEPKPEQTLAGFRVGELAN